MKRTYLILKIKFEQLFFVLYVEQLQAFRRVDLEEQLNKHFFSNNISFYLLINLPE
jgi:hypothetical protein